MKKFICQALITICDIQHSLPDWADEFFAEAEILILGYSCPFAMWSHLLNEKWNLDVWKPAEETRDRWPDYPVPDAYLERTTV